MTSKDMRAEFEKWGNSKGMNFARNSDGSYMASEHHVNRFNDLWKAWQAATEAAQVVTDETARQAMQEAVWSLREAIGVSGEGVKKHHGNGWIFHVDYAHERLKKLGAALAAPKGGDDG